MALSTDQVKQLASQGPLSTTQVQNLAATNQPTSVAPATPTAPVINAASLSPQQPINPVVPPKYIPPPIESLPTPNVPLTSEENAALAAVTPAQQLIDQLTGQTSDLAQKSFRTQQNESSGLNAAQSLATDLYNKSQSLKQQAEGINLQKATDIQGLQNSVQQGGANVTKGGLAPQQRAIETRANQQLLSNAIEQYNNAASYYAANGKVAAAQKAVDNAVDAEFTPKLQALEAAQANLRTLLASPLLSTAQKKQALNLQAQYDAQAQQIKDAAQVKKDTGDARIKAITNNPGLSTFAHDALMAAQSPEEVAAIVADPRFGLSSTAPLSESDKLDIQYKQAQIDKINSDIAKANAALGTPADSTTLSWADLITNGKATIKDVPAAYKNAVSVQLSQNPEMRQATELQQTALASAKDLLNKFNSGSGTFAVGGTRLFGAQYIPGTAPYDFQVNYDNLKSLLSLDNVKYLKGQGQVSDAERRLLQDASSKLNVGTSEESFKTALTDIISVLQKTEDYSKNTDNIVTPENARQAFSQIQLQPGTMGKIPGSSVTFEILPQHADH